MKTFRTLASFFAVMAVSCGLALAENPKNILFYGNSFTLGVGSTEAETFGGVPAIVKQLAIAAGYAPPRVENAAVSGQTLAWHLANNTGAIVNPTDFSETPDFQWDAVVIQEFSTNPTSIGNPPAFRSNAQTLLGQVRAHSPGVKGVLYETWARGPGHEFYTGNPPLFPGGPAQMQQELRDNYELARQDLVAAFGPDSVSVAPVGDAWESTAWNNLHATDIYHANARGTYLASLVLFGRLYGERSTVGLPKVLNSLSTQDAAELQIVADAFLPPGLTFDANGDRDVDADDLPGFESCCAGPETPRPPGAACGLMDGDNDGSVDLRDFAQMQTAVFVRPPSLSFATWDMAFTLPAGGGVESQANTLSASDASTPVVALSALDLLTQAAPTWLSTPALVSAAAPFPVDVQAVGLTPGTYFARVSASADGYEGASFTVTLSVTPVGGPQIVFVDIGETAQQTAGNYNNITQQQQPIANLIDSTGFATGVTLTIPDAFWPGSNQNGTTSPTGAAAMFDPQATRDNLFGNTAVFGGNTEPTAAIRLSGLSTAPGVTYALTFFASRLGVSDNRETAYTVSGANSAVTYLNASNNQSAVAEVTGIAADANGEILISLAPGPNNNNSFGFFYLGAMKIVRNAP